MRHLSNIALVSSYDVFALCKMRPSSWKKVIYTLFCFINRYVLKYLISYHRGWLTLSTETSRRELQINNITFMVQNTEPIEIRATSFEKAMNSDCVVYVDSDGQHSYVNNLWKVTSQGHFGSTWMFVSAECNTLHLFCHISISMMASKRLNLKVGCKYGSNTHNEEVEGDMASWNLVDLLLLLYDLKSQSLYFVASSPSFGIRCLNIMSWPTTLKLVSDSNGNFFPLTLTLFYHSNLSN